MTREEASFILANIDRRVCDDELSEALDMAINALELEPIAQERYEDLCEYFGGSEVILKNRDDFKAWLDRVKWHVRKAEELYEKYEQEPKTGHWITKQNEVFKYYCDKCGTGDNLRTQYCPNCGAKMIEPQESKGKK